MNERTMPPPTLDQLLFPSQSGPDLASNKLSHLLGDIRRSDLSIPNRLRSVCEDAAFVADVAAALPDFPLVANERCGSWYVDPATKKASAYFKSTDGHTGQWKFSLRRLNLHLLGLIGEYGGCIIVDSTRRGKRMPDALSKTIPIWCAVLNHILFPSITQELPGSTHILHTPPDTVSASEAAQITALLPGFVTSFFSLRADLQRAAGGPDKPLPAKPLRPVWITQDDRDHLGAWAQGLQDLRKEWSVVVCCTSSRRAGQDEYARDGYSYVQGAGDDTENWALGLTPGIFWRCKSELMDAAAAGEGVVESLIRGLVEKERSLARGEVDDDTEGGDEVWEKVREAVPGRGIYVGDLSAFRNPVAWEKEGVCVVVIRDKVTPPEEWVKGKRRLEVGLGRSKAASRALRDALPTVCEFLLRYIREAQQRQEEEAVDSESPSGRKPGVIILCESGKDLSIGVALAVYCWCFNDAGKVRREEDGEALFNKTSIRVRLGHIVTALPDVNPNRATLQSVNSFLMDWRR